MMVLPAPKMSRAALAAATFGLALMAASAAQAFTFENQTTANGNASNFSGTDSRFSTGTNSNNSSPAGRSGLRSGNGSLTFGGQPSFNQRYNADRMFESNGLLGKER